MAVEIPNPIRTGIDLAHKQIIHRYLTHGEAKNDREIAHERALSLMEFIQDHDLAMWAMSHYFPYNDPILETDFAGIKLRNPLGIAAGFDKDARVHKVLGNGLGFGLVTVGSITLVPYEGNERPRIFDLPQNDGLINRMGFPGKGVDAAEEKLARDDPDFREYKLAINISASKPSFNKERPIQDIIAAAVRLQHYGELKEFNVSSPNTPGVKGLQEPQVFDELAAGIQEAYRDLYGKPSVPYIFKHSPDLEPRPLSKVVQIAKDRDAAGISITNTTVSSVVRENLKPDKYKEETGGISGSPLTQKALEISHRVYEESGGRLPIKRAGGIKTGEDLWDALTYGGATIVDVYTAFVRPNSSTPNLPRYLLSDLAKAMRRLDMQGMQDFMILRGKEIAYPLAKK